MSIPKGWEEVRLGDIISIKSEKYTPKQDEDKKCVELEHLEQNSGRLLAFTNSSQQKSTKNVFKKGQVLFGKLRPYLKKYYLAEFDGVCSSEIWVMSGNNVLNNFLFYLVQSDDFMNAANISCGTKMPRADWKYMQEITIKLPPLKEQEKIAEILSSCDEHIKNLKNLKSELEKEKLHLMNELLSGKTRFSSFTTPWQEVKLGDLIKEISDKTTINNEYDILSVTKEGIFLQTEHFNHQVASKNNIGYKILRKGNLVFSTMNLWMGSLDILKNYEVGIVSPAYKVFEVDYSKCDLFFMDNFLKTKKMIDLYNLNSQTGASIVRKNLDLKGLLSENIKIPRLEEQKKIGEVLSACDERLECLNELITAQTTLKSHLLTELLTGNLRVKDYE